MRVGLIGGVKSSAITLQKLCEHGLNVVKVFGYKPTSPELVSGYCDLEPICSEKSIAFSPFVRINEHSDEINSSNLDYLFVVGISQLVSVRIIKSPKLGAIGFHPTKLPKGRGRAPIAWLINEIEEGAATFFMLDSDADTGAIVAQECFDVTEIDTAKSVEIKVYAAMAVALDSLLPKLFRGGVDFVEQDALLVTEYGVRKPEDGLIDWSSSARDIDRLVKSASDPHPGAFTYLELNKILVQGSKVELDLKIKGVQGRVLKITNNEILVQSGDGLIWLELDREVLNNIKVGSFLGYKLEMEIYELKRQVSKLQELVRSLL